MGKFKALGIILFLTMLVSMFSTASPALAHNWDQCSDATPEKWSGTSTTHWWPSTWNSLYTDAISNSQTEFNNSDFDYNWASQTSASVLWADLGSADTSTAGAAIWTPNCSTHTILAGSLYINFSHFNATPHTSITTECTVIHEMAHGAGFDHNTQVSVLSTPHSTRCHTNFINKLQSHDYSDINGLY